ncbi:motility quorum-sensing regulator / GCU-specific mRNA interferase toxin [Desulfonatronum thiosulfatophilum]|uniref:Motility quorum-sensing regulator / GCU-specific mRNA interferase toxin n=1 Tax=Desulfonatronum thiosulfatophilum TaxID=617002 RepID=A0A1G6EXA8_9BACT|nr:type II toxin-antitoxin system MqsR family toxin [Desulfonatronum thiosulfatophilum]SDB62077.1 motility quorum-sensing regulator / GCU-specific mRNA interferase toxin [Desulfonatronum thiosulfatophilum]
MEKRTPHCSLSLIKTLVEAGKVRSTMSALADAAAMGFDFEGVVEIVLSLSAKDFYKSMTTYSNHRIWQDVYRPLTAVGKVYLKLTVVENVLIVSFKEL